MYMGHFGVALALRRWTPEVPLAWLLFASIAIDVAEAIDALMPGQPGIQPHLLAHALVLSTAIAAASWAVFGTRCALACGVLAFSHLPLDWLTSRMPIRHDGPMVGLELYRHPWLDLALEGSLILIGTALLSRSRDLCRPAWPGLLLISATLLSMQMLWNIAMHGF